MWPKIGPIPSYGACYLAAFLLHYFISWRIARRYALRWWVWLTISTLFSTCSIAGAKLLYDLSHHGEFSLLALLDPKHYLQGGLWGGLLAYFALAVPAALVLTKNKRAALDLVALSIPIPFFLGKVGCFLNGCCYGAPTSLPWAVVYPPNSQGTPAGIPLHPTQIYEMLVMLLVLFAFQKLSSWILPSVFHSSFCILHSAFNGRPGTLTRRLLTPHAPAAIPPQNAENPWRGTMLAWFLAIYGFGRALCDTFRGDLAEQIHVGSLTLTQLLCLVAASLSAAFLLWWKLSSAHRPPQPHPPDLALDHRP